MVSRVRSFRIYNLYKVIKRNTFNACRVLIEAHLHKIQIAYYSVKKIRHHPYSNNASPNPGYRRRAMIIIFIMAAPLNSY